MAEYPKKYELKDPKVMAVLIGFFIWFILDSYLYGILAGIIAFVIFQKKETEDEDN